MPARADLARVGLGLVGVAGLAGLGLVGAFLYRRRRRPTRPALSGRRSLTFAIDDAASKPYASLTRDECVEAFGAQELVSMAPARDAPAGEDAECKATFV